MKFGGNAYITLTMRPLLWCFQSVQAEYKVRAWFLVVNGNELYESTSTGRQLGRHALDVLERLEHFMDRDN